MNTLLEKSINSVFDKWKNNIKTDIQRNDIRQALKSLSLLCGLKYNLYTDFYDQDIEDFIGILSNKIFPNPSEHTINESHVVMLDSLAYDYHGLTQQYLRAFISMDLNILFVIIEGRYKSEQILRELEEYGKAQIYRFDPAGQDILESLLDLYHTVVSFHPANIFTHSFSIIDSVLLKAFSGPTRYRIDYTDHLIWYGASSTDYIIEFRNWGATLSYQHKGISKERIVMQPFYPIENDMPFCGLPMVDDHKVIIFSGGATYKIMDKEMTFLKLLLRILKENPQAVVFFACRDDDRLLKKFIVKNQLQSRFFLIGYRSDLKSVYERIDIYLDTYPIGGGLMVQYAARNGRPVLTLKADNTLDYFEYDDNGIRYCTEYENMDDLCNSAKKLIENERHRKNIGSVLEKKMMSETEFNQSISKMMSEKKTDYPFTEISFDYEVYRRTNLKQFLQKEASARTAGILYSLYSYKSLIKFPYLIVFYGTVIKILEKLTSLKKNS